MKLVLDTNIYCGYAAGLTGVVEALVRFGDDIYLPAVVIGELLYGFLKGSRRQENEEKLERIIGQLSIGIIDITREVARKYSLVYRSLVNKGRKIPLNDVWIAASCMEIGGTLLTMDNHFANVDQIETIILT